jgi:3-oxoacid CoA-transferase
MVDKVRPSPREAVSDIFDGAMIHFGGFGGAGVPTKLIEALVERGTRGIVGVSNHCGDGEEGLAELIKLERVAKMITAFPGHRDSYHFSRLYEAGRVELEMVAQGTLAERIRAAGAGTVGFYTRAGVGTVLETGKEKRVFDGQEYLFERALLADFALVRAWRGDRYGNLVYRRSAQTFNPDMAMGARVTIAEVEELVEPGALDPDTVHTPGIFVDRVVLAESPDFARPALVSLDRLLAGAASDDQAGWTRAQMAQRVAQELPDGATVNLGIGMPTLVAAFVPADRTVFFHSENGLLGMGAFATEASLDRNLLNASRQAVELIPGAAVFGHSESFVMIRGGHLDLAVLGGYQVSSQGDLANWLRPGQQVGGIGGAMDLASGARRVLVMMEHTTRSGEPKIVSACSYPLTAQRCVDRIFTNLAVIDVTPDGLVLLEVAPGVTPEQVQAVTEPRLIISPDR